MKLRSILIVLAFITIPLLAACGDDDTTASVQQTAQAALNSGKTAVGSAVNQGQTAVNNGVNTVQSKATAAQNLSTTIQINEKDFSIATDNANPHHGVLNFQIENDGATSHQFVVLRTDIPEGQLPVVNGTVNTSASGITVISSVPAIAPGQTKPLVTNALDPGTYVLICNNPAHYQAGMHTTLKVVQ